MSTTDHRLLNPAALVRRILFFTLLVAMTLIQIFVSFRGLSSPEGMELAQISREISRNNGQTTKMIRPITIAQSQQNQSGEISFTSFPDTMYAPLAPFLTAGVFKIIGADNAKDWTMGENENVYALDRIIAAISVGFFLAALCINYFLIARIFDPTIAGVTALLLLLCDLIWQFSATGLPQMLMLMLASAGFYFAFRAIESKNEGNGSLSPAFLATLFFTLLTLTHWLCFWVLIGYLLFTVLYFKPRGAVAIFGLLFLGIASAYSVYNNYSNTGSPFGTAFLTSYNSNPDAQEIYMRSFDYSDVQFNFRNIILNFVQTTFSQLNNVFSYMGGIVVAPLFFLALLHSFRRQSIGDFKVCVLLCWIFSTIGMTLFGVNDRLDPNQLHILFVPLMTAYGLAIVAIFWARLGVAQKIPFLAKSHFIVIVAVSSGPLILSVIVQVKDRMAVEQRTGFNYPYFPDILNTQIGPLFPPNQVIATDQPWAVGWYADQPAVWLPRNIKQFQDIEQRARQQQTPIAAILVTPSSHASGPIIGGEKNLQLRFADFAPVIADGPVSFSLGDAKSNFTTARINSSPGIADISSRYIEAAPNSLSGRIPILGGGHLTLYRNNDEALLREAALASRRESEN